MSQISEKYLTLLHKHLYDGVTLRSIAMTEEQKLRTSIVTEVYQLWISNKMINVRDMCRKVAARHYAALWAAADVDTRALALCQKLGIHQGTKREEHKIANDVQAVNHVIGLFNEPTRNIDRAKVEYSADWLITNGMSTNNGRDVKSGAELLMRLNKDFDEKQQGFEDIARTDINITGDISILKPDRVNYTDEEKRKFAKQIGLSLKEFEDMLENDKGEYETAPSEPEEEYDHIAESERD